MMCTQIRMITMSSKIQRLNRIESSWHGIRFHRSNTVIHTTKNRSRASLFQAKHVQLYGAISYSAYFGLAPPVFPSVTSLAWPSVRSHLSPTPSLPHFMNLKSVQPGKPDTTTHNETQVVKQRAFMNSSLFAVFFVDWTFIMLMIFDDLEVPDVRFVGKGDTSKEIVWSNSM